MTKSVLTPSPCLFAASFPKSKLAKPTKGVLVFLVNVTPVTDPPVPSTGEVSPPLPRNSAPTIYCLLLAVPVIATVAIATAAGTKFHAVCNCVAVGLLAIVGPLFH